MDSGSLHIVVEFLQNAIHKRMFRITGNASPATMMSAKTSTGNLVEAAIVIVQTNAPILSGIIESELKMAMISMPVVRSQQLQQVFYSHIFYYLL